MHPSLALTAVVLATVAGCDAPSQPGAGSGEQLECAECLDEKCTDLVERCVADGCDCMIDCVSADGLGTVESCTTACALDDVPDGFRAVEQCLAFGCPDEDECATPNDYVPVDDTVLDTTDDIGGGALSDCAFDTSLAFDPLGDVLQLENADGSVCVKLERTNDGPGQLANTQFTLVAATLGPAGRVASVTTSSDLCWYASHHNFGDWAHVWTGTRRHAVRLDEFGHGGERSYALYTSDADDDDCGPEPPSAGTSIGEPLKLFPVNP